MTEHKIIGGRFALGGLLGQGGMATVYKGYDTRDKQRVAIKLLKPEIIVLDPDIVERFEREGEALRRLNHPNIVKVLATVREEDENYVVMEHVGGGDLRTLLDRYRHDSEPMPISRILEIALDLSDALTRAHRLQIIHRDIKPANVLLAEDGTPRLTDFGVARFGDSTRVTRTGSVIGTMAYLSPEGCTGEPLDYRGDIWAFGVMLYEMLTLNRPFEEDNSAALIYAILSKEYTPVRELRPDTPELLADLIDQMLVKEREERLGSVRLVGAQIEAIIQGTNVSTADLMATPPHAAPVPTQLVDVSANTPDTMLESATRARGLNNNLSRDNIYISYRASDTGLYVGRLYDRLVDAFGEHYIVRDVLMADPDTSTRGEILRQLQDSKVVLVVIGDDWLTEQDENGTSRLFAEKDRVRVEIETALRQEDLLIIPVLVEGATRPDADKLPASIRDLAGFEAVTLSDTNFDADVRGLIRQMKSAITGERPAKRGRWLALVTVAMTLFISSIILFVMDDQAAPDLDEILRVDPVPNGDYMILVTQMERVGGEERDVGRFIAADLREVFEESVPFSNLRIRSYPQVITTEEEALAVAEANDAPLIIWGNYDAEGVNVQLQVGTLPSLNGDSVFDRDNVETAVNARVRLQNERQQTLAASVVAVMNLLHSLTGDSFNVTLNLATIDLVDDERMPEVMGNSAAAYWHRYLMQYGRDLDVAIDSATQAIELNQHPVYYLGRSLTYLHRRELELAEQDILTASRLTPDEIYIDDLLLAQYAFYFEEDPQDALRLANNYVELVPDDWVGLMIRGGAALRAGANTLAIADLTRSIELMGDEYNNFPYFLLAAALLREGHIVEAQEVIQTVQRLFPDPAFAERITNAGFGMTAEEDILAASAQAFGNFTIGQWNRVIELTRNAETLPGVESFADIYVLQGLAYCNLGDYAEAEDSYDDLLEIAPDYTLGYVLRLQVRREQNNLRGVASDAAAVLNNDQSSRYRRYIPAIRDGVVDCRNLLTFDFEAYLEG